MKQYILPSILMAIGLGLIVYGIENNKGAISSKKVIQQVTDERGLTSVVYVEGKDTFALDYLTSTELNKLFSK